MSIIVFAGGGSILYNLYTSPATPNDRFEFFTYTSGEQVAMTQTNAYAKATKSKRKTGRQAQDNSVGYDLSNEVNRVNSASVASGTRSLGRRATSGSAAASKERDYTVNSSGNANGLLASGTTSRGSNRSSSESSAGNSGISTPITTPLAVPTAGSNGWVLVDPEPTTVTDGDNHQIVTVGDGAVALAFFVLLYAGVMVIRRKW